MEIKEIKDLMSSFDKSKSTVIEIKDKDFSIRLEKEPEIKLEKVVDLGGKNEKRAAGEIIDAADRATSEIVVSVDPNEKRDNPGETVDVETSAELVKAPLVGIFYAAASPDTEAYVQVGSKVKKGDVLCLIEAMKMMSEITAPKDGVIEKIFVKNQDVVGFEDPLFAIGD